MKRRKRTRDFSEFVSYHLGQAIVNGDCLEIRHVKPTSEGYIHCTFLSKRYKIHRCAIMKSMNVPYEEYKTFSKVVRHSCDNRICVNPKHLLLGDNYDNVQDRVSRGRNGRSVGSDNGNSKLVIDDIIRIRELAKQGLSYVDISALFSVSAVTISNVVNRKTWKHI